MASIDSLNRRLHGYQNLGHYSNTQIKPCGDYDSVYVNAVVLTPVTAALAAHGVTDIWENLRVIPLANADEVHGLVHVPIWADLRYKVFLRWHLISNNAAGGITLTTTVDKIDQTRNLTGSSVAGNGATALDTVIPAITDAETIANVPFASDYGIINGQASLYDALFIKLVAASASGADRTRVTDLEIAFKKLHA